MLGVCQKWRQDSKALVTCIPGSINEVEVVDSKKRVYSSIVCFHFYAEVLQDILMSEELPLITHLLGRPKVLEGYVIYMKYRKEAWMEAHIRVA